MNRRMPGLLILAVLALGISACTRGAEPPQTTAAAPPTTHTQPPAPAEPVTLRAAITGTEGSLNPYTYVTGYPGWNLLMLQYDTLLQIDANGIPQPWLAEDVGVSEDGLTYTITLVEGVTWHDGEPFTAEDVAFTVSYFAERPQGRFSRDLRPVASAEATGDLEVVITLSAPSPSFDLGALADVPVLPEHIWASITNPNEHQFEGPINIGTGPYRLVDHQPDRSYRFEANPDYFRGAPAVDELVLVQFANDSGALAAIRSGEVDVLFNRISPEQIDLLDAQDPIDIITGPEFTTQLLYFDTQKAPFDDIAVRRAISMSMDRQDLVDTVYLGSATPGSAGWIHPDQVFFNPAVETVTDIEAANLLLDDNGYLDTDGDGVREFDGQPMSFELLTPSSSSLRIRLAELVAEALAEIGIKAEVAAVEDATWEEAVWPEFDVTQGHNYELAIWGWSAPVQADPSRIAGLVHSDTTIGGVNLTGFADPEVDSVAEALMVESDEAARQDLLDELQLLIAERLPFVTLLYPDGLYAYNSGVYADWEFIAGQGVVNKLSLLPAAARP